MPFDRSRYPLDWEAISLRVKEAAGWRCERCGAPHGVTVCRAEGGYWSAVPDVWHDRDGNGVSAFTPYGDAEYGPEGQLLPKGRVWNSKVVLTTAHTDYDGGNRHDKHNTNGLRAWCQSCHLSYDHADHIAHAKAKRAAKKARLQPSLELGI